MSLSNCIKLKVQLPMLTILEITFILCYVFRKHYSLGQFWELIINGRIDNSYQSGKNNYNLEYSIFII